MRKSLFLLALILILPSRPTLAAEPAAPPSTAATNFDAAEASWKSQNWAETARLYEALAEENPWQGRFWYRLGVARYQLKEHEKSVEAYRRAADLGFQTGTSLYNAGCGLSLLGRTAEAVDALEAAIRNGLQDREELLRTDNDLDAIRDTELFRSRILPVVAAETSRETGWNQDLDYLNRRMRETHYDLFRRITPEEWQASIETIRADVPRLKDHEIVVELMKLFRRVGDGHTTVYPVLDGTWHALPVEFYVFRDGLYLRSADPEVRDVVGNRVLKIGSVSADEALNRVGEITARDNPMTVRWIAPRLLSCAEVLDALDITDGLDRVDVETEDPAGARRAASLKSFPLDPSLMHGVPPGYVSMADAATAPKPLWLKDPENPYWFEAVPDEDLVYFQFNSVRNRDEGETLRDFTKRLFDSMKADPPDALVIDVRRNNGGNNFLIKPIIDAVLAAPEINQTGHLFVVTGRSTFSACQNFVNRLEREARPMFVGEPTGSSPNFVGEDNMIVLPWSGLQMSGSSRYWQDSLSEDRRIWIAPDLIAEMSSTDFRTNRDPAMEAIRAYRANRRPSTAVR